MALASRHASREYAGRYSERDLPPPSLRPSPRQKTSASSARRWIFAVSYVWLALGARSRCWLPQLGASQSSSSFRNNRLQEERESNTSSKGHTHTYVDTERVEGPEKDRGGEKKEKEKKDRSDIWNISPMPSRLEGVMGSTPHGTVFADGPLRRRLRVDEVQSMGPSSHRTSVHTGRGTDSRKVHGGKPCEHREDSRLQPKDRPREKPTLPAARWRSLLAHTAPVRESFTNFQ